MVGVSACAQVNAVSLVSGSDIPQAKYRSILVFAENLEGAEREQAESRLAAAFIGTGVRIDLSTALFARSELSDVEKADVIRQRSIDAVLYFTIEKKDVVEKYAGKATTSPFGDETVEIFNNGIISTGRGRSSYDIVKDDGSVYRPNYILVARSELQDTRTAKLVWSGKTEAFGDVSISNMQLLFASSAKQIVSKLEQDHAI